MRKLGAEREIALVRKMAMTYRDEATREDGSGIRSTIGAIVARRGDDERLSTLARAGDKDADAALCLAAYLLIKKSEPLPKSMAKYVAEVLLDRVGKGQNHRRNANPRRDLHILLWVQTFTKRGWLPTRNRVTQDIESACSIIQKGLALAGENLSESRIEEIWREQNEWWGGLNFSPDDSG